MDQVTNSNPLQKFFRIPGISVRLPSGGNFQPEGNVQLTATGDLPVFPLRAADELLLKNPDALMSGSAIEEVIRSCCPGVKDPSQLTSPDVDVLMLAIRASSYGEVMTITSECPHCNKENDYDFNITNMLDLVEPLASEYPVRLNDDVVAYLRPHNLKNSTASQVKVFQETRLMQSLEGDDITPENRQMHINGIYKRLTELNVNMVAECVTKVVTPDGPVTDPRHIAEFVHNVQSTWVDKLTEVLRDINTSGAEKNHDVTCRSCGHEWKTTVEFDPASFFGRSSSNQTRKNT